jgi:hypothetical protein
VPFIKQATPSKNGLHIVQRLFPARKTTKRRTCNKQSSSNHDAIFPTEARMQTQDAGTLQAVPLLQKRSNSTTGTLSKKNPYIRTTNRALALI